MNKGAAKMMSEMGMQAEIRDLKEQLAAKEARIAELEREIAAARETVALRQEDLDDAG